MTSANSQGGQNMLSYTRVRKTAGTAVALVAVLAATAFAATDPNQTRESYVAAVEPICKKNTKTNERLLDKVPKLVREDKLKVAAKKVTAAAASGKQAVKALKQVPQPPADAAKLTKWIGLLEKEQKLLSELSQAMKAENKRKVQLLTVKLTHNGNQANTAVLGFEFDYCLIPTDQFN
jgi:hypothetical protein